MQGTRKTPTSHTFLGQQLIRSLKGTSCNSIIKDFWFGRVQGQLVLKNWFFFFLFSYKWDPLVGNSICSIWAYPDMVVLEDQDLHRVNCCAIRVTQKRLCKLAYHVSHTWVRNMGTCDPRDVWISLFFKLKHNLGSSLMNGSDLSSCVQSARMEHDLVAFLINNPSYISIWTCFDHHRHRSFVPSNWGQQRRTI